MKFGGVEHEQIEVGLARPGDFFFWNDSCGRQVGKLARVETYRGQACFVTAEVTATATRIARRAKRVPQKQVVSAWRRTRKKRID